MARRLCTICKQPMPPDAHHNANVCSDTCRKARETKASARYRARNPEKRAATVARYQQRHRPGEIVARNHGLSYESYIAEFERLGGACNICGDVGRLYIDHDHSCCPGKSSCGRCVRSLLCHRCNTRLLGAAKDDIDLIAGALAYLLGDRSIHLARDGLQRLRAWLT